MDFLILAINPGSTSTKIALYQNDSLCFKESIDHPQQETDGYETVLDQAPMRRRLVLDTLRAHGYGPQQLGAVVGRGGMLPPVHTGGYRVDEDMLRLIRSGQLPQHASNLGAVLADEIAAMAGGIPAYIYDAVTASDFPAVAKITGVKEIERKSFYHVLNSRAVAIRYAGERGTAYEQLNLLVAHLGGGITIGVHQKGRIVDSLSDDNGPFAPERSGGVPLLDLIDLCYSGSYTKAQMKRMVRGLGGLRSLLGTSDGREIARRIEAGDREAALVMQAQAYQVAKGIGLLAPVLRGACDGILLTGGLAYHQALVRDVEEYVSWIAPVTILPGEFEMEALALGALRILQGSETARTLSDDMVISGKKQLNNKTSFV